MCQNFKENAYRMFSICIHTYLPVISLYFYHAHAAHLHIQWVSYLWNSRLSTKHAKTLLSGNIVKCIVELKQTRNGNGIPLLYSSFHEKNYKFGIVVRSTRKIHSLIITKLCSVYSTTAYRRHADKMRNQSCVIWFIRHKHWTIWTQKNIYCHIVVS